MINLDDAIHEIRKEKRQWRERYNRMRKLYTRPEQRVATENCLGAMAACTEIEKRLLKLKQYV